MQLTEPVFFNLFLGAQDRFPAWRAGTTTLFDVPGYIDWRNRFLGIDSLGSLNVYNSGSGQKCEKSEWIAEYIIASCLLSVRYGRNRTTVVVFARAL
jgi:hypothetical protein